MLLKMSLALAGWHVVLSEASALGATGYSLPDNFFFHCHPHPPIVAMSKVGVCRLALRCHLRASFGAEIWSGHHFLPGGTRRFNSSNQFSTTLICVGVADSAGSLGLSISKRW